MTEQTPSYELSALIKKASGNDPELVLPDFQRSFRWKPDNMQEFLKSLILGYPIGVTLFWKGASDILEYRSIQFAEFQNDDDEDVDTNDSNTSNQNRNGKDSSQIKTYILDGQQRITSIGKIFTQQEVFIPSDSKGDVRFYLDLKELGLPIHPNKPFPNEPFKTLYSAEVIDKAIKRFDRKKFIREVFGSFSVTKKFNNVEIQNQGYKYLLRECLLPMTLDFLTGTPKILTEILSTAKKDYITKWSTVKTEETAREIGDEHYATWENWFRDTIQSKLKNRKIVAVELEDVESQDLSNIFKVINSTGLELHDFDLLVARLGTWNGVNDKTSLRTLIKGIVKENLLEIFDHKKEYGTFALQQLSRIFILSRVKSSLQDDSVLSPKITVSELRELADKCVTGLNDGLNLLFTELGVYNRNYVPFKDAITLAGSIDWKNNENLFKAYYWAIVFTEDMRSSTNTKTMNLYNTWKSKSEEEIKHEIVRRLMEEYKPFESFVETTTASVLYRATLTFVLHQSKKDWAKNELNSYINDLKLEDHHIFPKAYWTSTMRNFGDDLKAYRDCALNRILVSYEANTAGVDAANTQGPHKYLANFNANDMNYLCIPPDFAVDEPVVSSKGQYENLIRQRYQMIKVRVLETVAKLILDEEKYDEFSKMIDEKMILSLNKLNKVSADDGGADKTEFDDHFEKISEKLKELIPSEALQS